METLGLKNSRRAAYPGILSLNNSWGGCLRTKYLREREQTIKGKITVVLFINYKLWEEDRLGAEFAVTIKLHVVIKLHFEV